MLLLIIHCISINTLLISRVTRYQEDQAKRVKLEKIGWQHSYDERDEDHGKYVWRRHAEFDSTQAATSSQREPRLGQLKAVQKQQAIY